MSLSRSTIEDNLAPGEVRGQDIPSVRNNDALKRIAIALDQIVNRVTQAIYAKQLNDDVKIANQDDINEAKRQTKIVSAVLATANAMIANMESQLEPYLPAKAKPKTAKDTSGNEA